MSRLFIFADEAGCFAFNRNPNISKYFIVCTVTTRSCAFGTSLLDLRRELAWKRIKLGDYFHATTDSQSVRDEVFKVICQQDFQIQATIMEKAKAQPQIKATKEGFYQHGWHSHFQYGMDSFINANQELMITTASVGTKKGQTAFTDAVNNVVKQTIKRAQWSTAFWPCQADPCLQLADYCTWAIQRKWERNDCRSYDLIKDRITYEYDLWKTKQKFYY